MNQIPISNLFSSSSHTMSLDEEYGGEQGQKPFLQIL
jgi:hypothetical protein